jgi:DHA1 family multidrug resistance protein-like MFS transporter
MLNRDLKLIFTTNLVGSFGDGLFSFLLPVYMGSTLGADSIQIGTSYAVLSIVAALTLLLAGTLSDKYDRKKVMIAGWIAWLPAPLIFSVARNWVEMLPGMVLYGFWLGGPSGTAYIVTTADRKKLTLTFTTMSAGWSLGYIFSPAAGGYVASNFGMKPVFYSAFVFYAIACSALFFIKSQRATRTEADPDNEYSFLKLLRNKRLMTLAAFFSALMFILIMFRPFIPKFVSDVYRSNDFMIGTLGSITFASSAVLGIILGRLGDRSSKKYPLALTLLLNSVAVALLLFSGNLGALVISFILISGSYLTLSLMNAIIGPLAPESCRARWIAVPQVIAMFASFLAPYLGGYLYAYSPQYPFLTAVIVMPILAILVIRFLKE